MGMGTLPAADIGAQVLILDNSKDSNLRLTPVPHALTNGTHSDFSIVVRPSGSADLAGRVTFHGVAAAKQRSTYANKSKQVHRIARMVKDVVSETQDGGLTEIRMSDEVL